MAEKIKIFAYGSLINQRSLTKTSPNADNIFPAKLYNLSRSFCLPSSHRIDQQTNRPVCVLNLVNSFEDNYINGICFELDESELGPLRYREREYELRQIKVHDYFDEQAVHDSYAFIATDYQPYHYLSGSKEQKHYIDVCLSGCEVYGQSFVDDFKQSTGFWGINDDDHIEAIWRGHY